LRAGGHHRGEFCRRRQESCAAFTIKSTKWVLPPAYHGPRAPDRRIEQTTPRRVAIVGAYRWTPEQMNLSPFPEAADPILQNAGVGVDIVGDGPDSFRKAWEARVKATRFHGFVDSLGEFLAARRKGLIVEETGGGFKHKNTRLYLQSRAYCRDKRQHDRLTAYRGAALFIL
jgi:hypothetical protein